jgi:hypothetical protein
LSIILSGVPGGISFDALYGGTCPLERKTMRCGALIVDRRRSCPLTYAGYRLALAAG